MEMNSDYEIDPSDRHDEPPEAWADVDREIGPPDDDAYPFDEWVEGGCD